MRIAHETRMEAYDQLGDMVIGFQIHATMDTRVRPEHAARSGTIYYKKPAPGQPGLDKMPRPPLEEDGTVAHNCRCWITPVLEVQKQIEEDPAAKAVFTNARGKLIPNPAVYSDWFANAPAHDQGRVVGARRMKLVKNLLPQEKITWGHFVDPDSGRLMDEDELFRETPKARQKRLDKFNSLLAKRKELTQQVANFGYLPPSPPAPVIPVLPVPITKPKPQAVIPLMPAAVRAPKPPPGNKPQIIIPTIKLVYQTKVKKTKKGDPITDPMLVNPVLGGERKGKKLINMKSPIHLGNAELTFNYSKNDSLDILGQPGSPTTPLRSYTWNGYDQMNAVERGHRRIDSISESKKNRFTSRIFEGIHIRKVEILDDQFEKHGRELPVGTILYRGGPPLKLGENTEAAFLSTTLSWNIARDFQDKDRNARRLYTITVRSPGIKAFYVARLQELQGGQPGDLNVREKEILIERNMVIYVTGNVLADGSFEAELYVGKNTTP